MNRLKELRQEKKLTQQELADYIGVTKRTYIYWEKDERQIKPDKAQQLADYFGVEVGYLLGYNAGHEEMYKMFGIHPKKGDMGIVSLSDMIGLNFIKDLKDIEQLKTDTTVAIKFLETIQAKLLLYGSVSKTYTNEIENTTNFLIDFYDGLERREKELNP